MDNVRLEYKNKASHKIENICYNKDFKMDKDWCKLNKTYITYFFTTKLLNKDIEVDNDWREYRNKASIVKSIGYMLYNKDIKMHNDSCRYTSRTI